MALRRRPSGRDCALARAALENLEPDEKRAAFGASTAQAPHGEGGGDRLLFAVAMPGAATRPIRVIDLERRARFARVVS